MSPQSTTVTVTPTSTFTYCPSPTPDTSCNNQGLQWAYYPNPFGSNGDREYSAFDPTYFKTANPTVDGVTGYAGISGPCGDTSSTYSFYGNTEYCSNITLDYRGYLYAAQTGTFTFSVSNVDDIVLVWVGPNAYSGWTRTNAALVVTYADDHNGAGVAPATYEATYGE